jgi:hypothetical protein
MDVTLLYFDGCPNWTVLDARLAALSVERPEIRLTRRRVDTVEEAEQVGFHGSPSILVNGVDPFATGATGVGLACRVYQTPDGPAGAPTLDQLRAAITDA